MPRILAIAVLVFGLLANLPAAAEGHWYAGLSLGAGEANALSFEDIDDGSALSGSFDDQDFGWKLFGGYAYNDFVSIEGAWVDLGEIALNAQSDGNGSIFDPGAVTAKIDASGFVLSVVGHMPVNDRLDIFAKVGFFAWEATTTLSNAAFPTRSTDDDGSDPMFGIGAAYEFNDRVTIRGEYEKFSDIKDRDGSLFSLGISLGF